MCSKRARSWGKMSLPFASIIFHTRCFELPLIQNSGIQVVVSMNTDENKTKNLCLIRIILGVSISSSQRKQWYVLILLFVNDFTLPIRLNIAAIDQQLFLYLLETSSMKRKDQMHREKKTFFLYNAIMACSSSHRFDFFYSFYMLIRYSLMIPSGRFFFSPRFTCADGVSIQ